MDARFLLFSRAPEPGRAKTRLIPRLGAEGAARLHSYMTARLIHDLVRDQVGPLQLWCTPDASDPFFRRCAQRFGVALHVQHSGDLGQRMRGALTSALREAPLALLMGTDLPELDAATLRAAVAALEEGYDAVLLPAEDGGYGLIGLKRVDETLFRDMPWGTAAVMAKTRERMRALNWRWKELPVCRDLDRPEDLRNFTIPDALADAIEQLFGRQPR